MCLGIVSDFPKLLEHTLTFFIVRCFIFKFLNTGGFVGSVPALRMMLTDYIELANKEPDPRPRLPKNSTPEELHSRVQHNTHLVSEAEVAQSAAFPHRAERLPGGDRVEIVHPAHTGVAA